MHVKKKTVIQNIEMVGKIAREQFGQDSPEIVLKVAGLIAAEQQRQALGAIADGRSYPLEIHAK